MAEYVNYKSPVALCHGSNEVQEGLPVGGKTATTLQTYGKYRYMLYSGNLNRKLDYKAKCFIRVKFIGHSMSEGGMAD